MRQVGVRPHWRHFSWAVLAAAVACVGLAMPARAAVYDPCGLLTQAGIAAAFGLTDTVKHTTVAAPPGNPEGAVRIRCQVFTWRGRKPTNDKQKAERLHDGTMARLNIQSWILDEGPQAEVWRAQFDDTLKQLRGAASSRFLTQLHGERQFPPVFGAESSVAFSASSGGIRKVRALWWNRNAKSLIVIDAVEAQGKPAVSSLEKIAAAVVIDPFF